MISIFPSNLLSSWICEMGSSILSLSNIDSRERTPLNPAILTCMADGGVYS
jgi:hypothetical protein